MSQTLSQAATALRETARQLGESGVRMAALDPGAPAFAAGGAGRLGDLGHDLHLLWRRTLDARVREAAAHAERFAETADAVHRAGGGYAEIDEAAGRGQPEVS